MAGIAETPKGGLRGSEGRNTIYYKEIGWKRKELMGRSGLGRKVRIQHGATLHVGDLSHRNQERLTSKW